MLTYAIKIVEADSAILTKSDRISHYMSLPGNHITMVKIPSAKDHKFEMIWGPLNTLLDKLRLGHVRISGDGQ